MAKEHPVELVLPFDLWTKLRAHLFRGDHDEHGAVIAAGVSTAHGRTRLLARNLHLAEDGVDYLPGQRGYRMLSAAFVRDCALACRDERLAYLAVHNHGGVDQVAFSRDDMNSHERGYQALRDVTRGQIVGGLVFAEAAVAGDIWMDAGRFPLQRALLVGPSMKYLFPSPQPRPKRADASYDRQARLFGDRGQALLKAQRVAVIGLGGIGSLVSEYIARLGVGALLLVDPDRLDVTNVPRVVNSRLRDALGPFPFGPTALRKRSARHATLKVDLAERAAHRANPRIDVQVLDANITEAAAATALASCDFIFLCADSMQARLVFNAVVHQYLIPGMQLGAKVPVDKRTGDVGVPFSVVRPVTPTSGCLWCNGLILPDRLAEEALTEVERKAQRYVEEEEVVAPSVISMNAVAAAHAVNDYLFRVTGLRDDSAPDDYVVVEPRAAVTRYDAPRRDPDCPECGTSSGSRYARGDSTPLPTRPPVAPTTAGALRRALRKARRALG